jgi:hypothetical protein
MDVKVWVTTIPDNIGISLGHFTNLAAKTLRCCVQFFSRANENLFSARQILLMHTQISIKSCKEKYVLDPSKG